MTIHKAQGKTLNPLNINFENSCFEHGQLYVALSRASKLDNLSIDRYIEYDNLIVDKKVKIFLRDNDLI
jgi:ATP-dependent exoDNAse (exonuclease V) alpha subunit